MNEANQLSNKRLDSFFNVIVITIILLSLNTINIESALIIRCIGVRKTPEFIEYMDGNSLTIKDKREL